MKNVYLILLLLPLTAFAADADYTLVIKEHRFEPSELSIPAGKKVKLRIENKDATPEEFESYSLNREKVISGYGTANIYIGPLESGRYPFFGEFNKATAQGIIIVK